MPYKIYVTSGLIAPWQWCKEQFGTDSKRWYMRGGEFLFYNEEDFSFFCLRWAQCGCTNTINIQFTQDV